MVDNPLETKDYTITVDFKKGPQRVIQGTYDKKALPEFWGDFADSVWQFMRFYGMGEILDPALYERSNAAELITSIAVWNLKKATKAIITLPMRTIFRLVIM